MTTHILVLVLLLALSAFFSGTETAFTSLSMIQIQQIKKRYRNRGALIERLHNQADTLLATVLIGNNLVNIGMSVISSELTIRLFGSTALGITTGVLTMAILVFGEIIPKQTAILNNAFICIHTVRIIYLLSIIFRPLIWLLSGLSRIISRLSPKNPRTHLTLDGILHMVKHAENIGILENYRTRMVKSIFRFNDVSVHAIMTHRTKVFSLPASLPISEALPLITEAGYSRIPVFGRDQEQILGIVLEKEVIRALNEPETTLKDLMMPPVVVPESWKIHRVFTKLKAERLNLAIVLDEYGGLAGVVTMEDLVEEIIGELYDENEEKEGSRVTRNASGWYTIQGDTPLHVLEDIVGIEFPHDRSIETIGGYLADLAEELPNPGTSIPTDAGTFIIDRISRKQILSVRFRPGTDADET
ncbi:hemolysin family protein [Spirochaeta lutea]|uniref:HlyC/CorC family transporter n=1 Tax=Spirochaeta lutea TaxID=1480694 RepID=A0A098QWD8_9SPIO|nr:hemolysin family protein [Spirochaeta lutea]KGE71841.1 hypothetical protein DC28_08400 [Spirochaeta lutea]